MKIAAYVPDLMDRSKVSAAAPEAVFVSKPEDLVDVADADVVVLDLTRPGAVDVIPKVKATTGRSIDIWSRRGIGIRSLTSASRPR